jgi:hypothetical protein
MTDINYIISCHIYNTHTYIYNKPKGGVVVHSGRRRHAGCEIFSGMCKCKRMLLVGFIDEINAEVDTADVAECACRSIHLKITLNEYINLKT